MSNYVLKDGSTSITGDQTFEGNVTVDGTVSQGGHVIANKNELINGDKRINQHDFAGDWSILAVGDYGYDMWKKSATASSIDQVIEDGNYEYSTVYTVSGTNVTTAQITSPASGHWTVTVPDTADNIKVETGTQSTPFVPDDPAVALAKCRRYLLVYGGSVSSILLPSTLLGGGNGTSSHAIHDLSDMRVVPSASMVGNLSLSTGAAGLPVTAVSIQSERLEVTTAGGGVVAGTPYRLEADADATARLILSAEL